MTTTASMKAAVPSNPVVLAVSPGNRSGFQNDPDRRHQRRGDLAQWLWNFSGRGTNYKAWQQSSCGHQDPGECREAADILSYEGDHAKGQSMTDLAAKQAVRAAGLSI